MVKSPGQSSGMGSPLECGTNLMWWLSLMVDFSQISPPGLTLVAIDSYITNSRVVFFCMITVITVKVSTPARGHKSLLQTQGYHYEIQPIKPYLRPCWPQVRLSHRHIITLDWRLLLNALLHSVFPNSLHNS